MSFADCLRTAVEGGELRAEDAKRLEKDFKRFRDRFANNSEAMADAEAKKALAELLAAESAHQKRKAKLSLQSIKRIAADISSYKNPKGEADIAAAAVDLLEHFGTAPFASVEGRRKAIVGMAHARMEDALYHFRRSAIAGDLARHNKADLDNVLREAFGESTGDASSKHFAKVWEDTHEWLRQRFNAAGGAIGKLERWGLPQHHDARALRKAGMQAWKDSIRPLLDVTRMKHPLTGKAVDPGELDEILTEIWTNVATEGWAKKQPARQAFGRGSLANQRADHRFLIFRDADSWIAYQRDFGGGGDIFAAMMGHINAMAKDIAAMEVLGPNPSGTIEWLKQAVKKQAELKAAGQKSLMAGDPASVINGANATERRLDSIWASIRGTLETPVNSTFAGTFAGIRSLITASVLGSAALSSLSDIGTSIVARQFAGLKVHGALGDIIKAMGPTTRREAVSAGLILDSAMHVFHQQARYVGTLDGPGWSSFIADRVLTLSGLTPWTQSARHAFGLAFMRTAAENIDKPLDKLPEAFRSTFARYGIRAADWDRMRRMPMHDMGSGVKILRPQEIAERVDERLAERFLEMIQSETEYAIPNGSNRSKVMLVDQNRPGTFMGEVTRSFAQFKSFGAVFVLLHGRRIHGLLQGKTPRKGAGYAASLLISTTLFGAMAMQLKGLAQGRDPQDMTDPAFWGGAVLQGGGLGIYGDYFFSSLNRQGVGLAATLAGPVVQRGNDLLNLTLGNAVQLATGEKTQFGRETLRFLKSNTPGSTIWYSRLAWERIVWDNLQFLVDPEADKAFKNRQRFFQKEFGQGFWWEPGRALPQRAPNLGAAFGG